MKTKNLFLVTMVALFGVVLESSGQEGTYPANQTSYLGVNPVNSVFSVHAGFDAAPNAAPTAAQITAGQQGMNCFIGVRAGKYVTSGNNNVFLGYQSGLATTTGGYNSFLGRSAGAGNLEGAYNTFVGFASGYSNSNGSNNTYLGYNTGWGNANGVGNVFLGNRAGNNLTGPVNNTLIISNDHTLTPLVYGNFATKYIDFNGSVGVNLVTNAVPNNRLEVRHGTANNSGLRFTNLLSTSTPQASNGKVLTVNSSGDVILVNDMVGTGSTSQTTISAGTNITVTGDPTAGYVINSTASGTDINIYNSDSTINTSSGVGSNPTPGLRTVTMRNNNLFFDTSGSEFKDDTSGFGRVYIGSSIANNGSSIGFPLITADSRFRLFVEGGILSERVKVALRSTNNWADYVFAKDYKLTPLNEVEAYINENNHLPSIESADELVKNGLDLGEMQAKQMGKIEELTLYTIEQQKQLDNQAMEIEDLKKQVKLLLEKK